MKRDKKYYVALSIVIFIGYFIVSIYNLYDNVSGFLITLLTYITFNVVWYVYHEGKGE